MLPIIRSIKKHWIYFLFVFAVSFFAVTSLVQKNNTHNQEIQLTLKTFHTNLGWGYDVYTNDSVYIHQPYIPALEGRKGFASEAQAIQTGNLAISKMKQRKLPVISLAELKSIGITK